LLKFFAQVTVSVRRAQARVSCGAMARESLMHEFLMRLVVDGRLQPYEKLLRRCIAKRSLVRP
jgi:hypothetical protein